MLTIDNSQEDEVNEIHEIKNILEIKQEDMQNLEQNPRVQTLIIQLQKKKELEV